MTCPFPWFCVARVVMGVCVAGVPKHGVVITVLKCVDVIVEDLLIMVWCYPNIAWNP